MTMTSKFASSWTASRLFRQSRRSSMVFQLQMVMLRSKSGMNSFGADQRTDPNEQRNEGEQDSRQTFLVFSKVTNQAEMGFPDHVLFHLFCTFSAEVKDFDAAFVPAWQIICLESVEQIHFVEKNGEIFIERISDLWAD